MTRIDRRALFTSGAAAALLTATGVSLDAAPRGGGRMRLAVPRPDGAFIPAARGAVFETLTEIGPDGVLKGALATGWQSDADARIWTLTLRDGVHFHDGRAFGAADVLASLETHGMWENAAVAQAEQSGALQVRLELAAGNPQLPYMLSNADLVIAPADDVTGALAQGIGTGLYRTRRQTPGRDFLGDRVAQHYKDGQAGWVDSIEIVVIPDAAVRAEALRDGFVDVAELPLAQGLRGRGDFRFHPSADDMALAANHNVGLPKTISARAPLDDGRIAERWWMTRA